MKILQLFSNQSYNIFMVTILLLTVLIIVGGLYNWRDFWYEQAQNKLELTIKKAQVDSTYLAQTADNLAVTIKQLGTMLNQNQLLVKELNRVLVINGFQKHLIPLPNSSKGE